MPRHNCALLANCGLRGNHRSFVAGDLGSKRLDLCAGDALLLGDLFRFGEATFGIVQRCCSLLELGSGALERELSQLGVEIYEHITGCNTVTLFDQQFRNEPGNGRAEDGGA